jgi:parallel beta-helix repeat protein
VKNVIGDSNAGVWLNKTTNSLIEKNTLLGPSGGILAVGSEDALQIINNRVTGQIWIQSQADSDSGPSASIVVSGNIITPTLNGTGGCGLVQDASSSRTKPIRDFTFSHNICRIQGTDASHHVFGAFSLVSNNSGTCTVDNNVVEAYGQYVDYALWEMASPAAHLMAT